MILRLPLKKKWFKMTEEGFKQEDYREITPYWIKRLVKGLLDEKGVIHNVSFPVDEEDYERFVFKDFKENVLTLGYPKLTDNQRIIKLGHKRIEIGTGKEEWGAEPNKIYFIIKHTFIK